MWPSRAIAMCRLVSSLTSRALRPAFSAAEQPSLSGCRRFGTKTQRLCFSSSSSPLAVGGPAPGSNARVIVITSGKGGVGKSTTAASISWGLANRGKKTAVIDFDIGLRNLDLHLGMERRVVFDFINVLLGEASLSQALVADRTNPNLYLLAASQTKDKSYLTSEGVATVIGEMRKSFDFIICDSPAGIENGAFQAMQFADEAVVCTNPEVSSVRDSDKMIGLIGSKSWRAVAKLPPVKMHLLVTRFNAERAAAESMLDYKDIEELLNIPLLGVIPESTEILESTNLGRPVISRPAPPNSPGGRAAGAYADVVARLLGEIVPLRFTDIEPKPGVSPRGILSRFFK